MTQIKKIADLAFHKSTEETVAIVAFLKLRNAGFDPSGTEPTAPAPPQFSGREQISSWKIAGPDSYIMMNTFYGAMLMESCDGKCHIKRLKKGIFDRKQYYTITLKYGIDYSKADIERQFGKLTK